MSSTMEAGNRVDGLETLNNFLREVRSRLEAGEYPTEIVGPFGHHGVQYGADDSGIFARIGFTLPDGVYAEVEDGTYGEQQAWRIYLTGHASSAITDHGYSIELDGGFINIRDQDGNHVDDVPATDERFPRFLQVIVEASR